jgi:hypothetical protein
MVQLKTATTSSLIRVHCLCTGLFCSLLLSFLVFLLTTVNSRHLVPSLPLSTSNYSATYFRKNHPSSTTKNNRIIDPSWYNKSILNVLPRSEKVNKQDIDDGIVKQVRNYGNQKLRQTQTTKKKLMIDLSGYNVPTPATLVKNAAMMKRRGYSGSIIRLDNMWNEPFVNDIERTFNETDFATNYPTLQKMNSQLTSYTHNFLICYSQMSNGWTWLVDRTERNNQTERKKT